MLSDETKNKIEKNLINQKSQVENELISLKKDDPVSLESVIVPSELGTDSWEAEVHAKTVIATAHLTALYQKIKASLNKLKMGTYGKCEKCGNHIEVERLEVLPTATHCTLCF